MRETRRGEDEATFGKFDVMIDEGRLLGEHDVGQRFFLVREGVQVHKTTVDYAGVLHAEFKPMRFDLPSRVEGQHKVQPRRMGSPHTV